ncbi:Peptidase U61, LD-carboxypeptidase A [Candidatus Sulfotelmatobacter kueseliae]|uniref:Peptidase U61, LD-carboxypeptidase A n=1 Tax=Candidatus Sulfotelmatobacter kueseliae TaxID=2042962 RepID=A0A2U3K958_9BACT|nr:Peptidase U61, LD-carboxypeptidase A [Candidatus Sulfotelmatobacter kueseliae]
MPIVDRNSRYDMSSSHLQRKPRVKPPALRPGDPVGIVAPASNIKPAELDAGCVALQRAGYRAFYLDSILDQDIYFAGSVERRAQELEEMFVREDVRAIVCARGGYGANYLLAKLDLAKIQAHPKIFVGYSDITSLLTYFADAGGFVTFHGPMAAKDWTHENGVDFESWQAALSGAVPWDVALGREVSGLADGEAEGILYGGCLSILVASLGTSYEIKTRETILFLEDVAAKPYQIDRMLMQLKLAGKLEGVRGIIFGEMLDCAQTASQDYTLQEVVARIVGKLGVPVAYGLRSGHVTSGNITLPFGVQARLTVRGGQVGLRILEPAIQL